MCQFRICQLTHPQEKAQKKDERYWLKQFFNVAVLWCSLVTSESRSAPPRSVKATHQSNFRESQNQLSHYSDEQKHNRRLKTLLDDWSDDEDRDNAKIFHMNT